MTSSKFPSRLDMFQTKVNAQFAGDTNGSYVMAEDINELQDAILAIEQALGINPQGSNLSVGERITFLEDSSVLKVPPALVYLGSPTNINGATNTDEAVAEFLRYNYIVLGNGVEQLSHPEHDIVTDIISQIKASRDVQIYGYIDCGATTSNLTISQLQISIKLWTDMGVTGIYCGNFGFEKGVSRDRQNQILDSIHQYNVNAILQANDPDQVFSDAHDDAMNPNWIVPSIVEGDFFHYEKFVVDTSATNAYTDIVSTIATLKKLHQYRLTLGIRILATPLIRSNVTQPIAQSYFEYAHAIALLGSVDAFYPATEGYGASIDTATTYNVFPIIGDWYVKNPSILVSNGVYTRKTSFGQLSIDTVNHTYSYDGIFIPYERLRIAANTIDGNLLKDYSIDDKKIKNYDGSRLIDAINTDTTPDKKIDINKIGSFGWGNIEGNLPTDILSVNILNALEAHIGKAFVDELVAGSIDAKHITAGTIDAERISATIIDAMNLYAETMVVGSATINTAVIGDLTVDNMKANIIKAINAEIDTAKIKSAVIEDLNADKITAGDIDAERIQVNVLNAVAAYMDTAVIGDAVIKKAAIGFLKADEISVDIINAINGHFDSLTVDKAKIGELDANHIKASVITAINANIETAKINGAIIDKGTIGTAQIGEGVIHNGHIADLDAGKLTAGSINTAKVSIQGDNGMLTIVGNRLQIFDNNTAIDPATGEATGGFYERVAIGDVHGDGTLYGLEVRGPDGTTVLYDHSGVYNEGITPGAITNPKIRDDAVDGRVIKAKSIVADHIYGDTVVVRLMGAREILAEHIQTGIIRAGSALIEDGAIGSAHIGQGEIKNAHIDNLSADKINAGTIKAQYVQIGSTTTFADGYDPTAVGAAVRTDLRLSAPLPTHITLDSNGITANSTTVIGAFARLDYRGLYIKGGGIVIDGGLTADNLAPEVTDAIGKTETFVDNTNNVNVITVAEKNILKRDWDGYAVENTTIMGQANYYWPDIAAAPSSYSEYTQDYQALDLLLHTTPDLNTGQPMLASSNLLVDSNVDGPNFNAVLLGYKNSKFLLLQDIAKHAKDLADGAQDYAEGIENDIVYKVEINSSKGNVFQNGQISTVLTATVYRGSDDITETTDASDLKWTRVSEDAEGDYVWNQMHSTGAKSITITKDDIIRKATFNCRLLGNSQ